MRWTATRRIDAPVDRVWNCLVETALWPRWGPTVRDVEGPDRIEIGSSGRVTTPFVLSLSFEVTHLVEGRSWSWKVAGVPATGHRVEAGPDDTTVVSFDCPWWTPFYLPVLRRGLARLDDVARDG